MNIFPDSTKIGINLYYADFRNEMNSLIAKGDTLLFDSFIKKISYQTKPEFVAVAGNPAQPSKEQVSVERYYDIQFEVLSESMEEAIENYKKLLLMIHHLFYITVYFNSNGELDITRIPPNKFGNLGIIFKGNPPISDSFARGIVQSKGAGKRYEVVIKTENFSYDIDLDKGYIFANLENDFGDLIQNNIINRRKKRRNEDDFNITIDNKILVPLSFTININGTLSPDKYRPLRKQFSDINGFDEDNTIKVVETNNNTTKNNPNIITESPTVQNNNDVENTLFEKVIKPIFNRLKTNDLKNESLVLQNFKISFLNSFNTKWDASDKGIYAYQDILRNMDSEAINLFNSAKAKANGVQ